MSAWDPATRTFYGLVETSESVPAPMLFGFSAATGAASAPVALCEGGYGSVSYTHLRAHETV